MSVSARLERQNERTRSTILLNRDFFSRNGHASTSIVGGKWWLDGTERPLRVSHFACLPLRRLLRLPLLSSFFPRLPSLSRFYSFASSCSSGFSNIPRTAYRRNATGTSAIFPLPAPPALPLPSFCSGPPLMPSPAAFSGSAPAGMRSKRQRSRASSALRR